MILSLLAGGLGCALLWGRLRVPTKVPAPPPSRWPAVGVVIPARNEAANLPRLLASLAQSGYAGELRVWVVDDHSHDQTAELARRAGADVLSPPSVPPAWGGKSWACRWGAQAALAAGAELLLLLDADTELCPGELTPWVAQHLHVRWDLSCPLPWHRCEATWERVLGAFHLLYLVATTLNPEPPPGRLYANGQCLLFTAETYRQGGHERVAGELAEDLALARDCLKRGGRYGVYAQTVYRVRMYPTPADFAAGWRRNLRLGMAQSKPLALLEVVCVMLAGLGPAAGDLRGGTVLMSVCMLLVAARQRRFGNFASWGALFTPLAIAVFMGLSLLGLLDRLARRPIPWKGRSYAVGSLISTTAPESRSP
ncbi:MAG: glycosyltransferase [Candidatus Sericytochromatia bacterium]